MSKKKPAKLNAEDVIHIVNTVPTESGTLYDPSRGMPLDTLIAEVRRLRSDDWLEKAAEEVARWATTIDSVTPADPRDKDSVLAILRQHRDGK